MFLLFVFFLLRKPQRNSLSYLPYANHPVDLENRNYGTRTLARYLRLAEWAI
jgi:hypothetical protein